MSQKIYFIKNLFSWKKQNRKDFNLFLKNSFFKFFIGLMIFWEILFCPITSNAYVLVTIENNLNNCKLVTNCTFQTWKVDDSKKAFTELIQILENTPRLKITEKDNDYIHAIATSRIMKFTDDIEIKILKRDNIFQVKSSSRLGIYDLGVNKRRVETLRFRLIDLNG